MSKEKNTPQKSLKALVETRSTIKKKYQTLHSNRVKGDQKLKEKYAPITNSIQQLIEKKKDVNPFENYENVIDNGRNVDISNEFDDMSWDDFEFNTPNQMNINNKRARDIFDDESLSEQNEKKYRSQSARNTKTNREIKKRDKADLHNIRKSGEQTFLKKISMQGINKRNREISPDSSSTTSIAKRREVLATDNGTDFLLKTMKKKNDTKKKQKNELHKIREEQRKVPDPVVVVEASPEDYNDRGEFVGSKPKRSKREIPLETFIHSAKKINAKRKSSLRRNSRISKHPRLKYGKGLEKEFIPYTENIAYEYYDDPNELCERLNLLLASKTAGNSNHDQEINSIIEELRESGIIE